MAFHGAEFLRSAVHPKDFPAHDRREVALAGRSNVGKSSLVNALAPGRLAFVSKEPGRTRTINFYALNERLCLVDLPGYGYAKVSRSVKEAWGPMIEGYLRNREHLRLVLVLIDARHGPTKDDLSLWQWLQAEGIESLAVATKWDKVKKGERHRRLAEMSGALGEEPLTFSSVSKEGKDRLVARLNAVARE